jgi:hypothetical protein
MLYRPLGSHNASVSSSSGLLRVRTVARVPGFNQITKDILHYYILIMPLLVMYVSIIYTSILLFECLFDQNLLVNERLLTSLSGVFVSGISRPRFLGPNVRILSTQSP